MKTAVLAALLVVLSPAAASAATHSIVVGHNAVPEGVDGLRQLEYADDDAARWAQVLGRLGEVHLLTVLDAESQRAHPGVAAKSLPPTPRNFEGAVASVRAAIAADAARGESSTVFFVYSGHGAHTPEGAPFLTLQGGHLDRDALYAQIAALPTRTTHLVIDACHAAAIVGVRGGFFGEERDAEHVDTATVLNELSTPPDLGAHPHVGVLLSASAGESSHEWSEVRAGVFSHEVLSALLGPADINADGRIEYSEVAAYVAAANREVDDPRAVPTVVARPPARDARAPLVEIAALGPALRGRASALGRFTIETSTSVRWADGNLSGDHEVRVALPRGTAYLVTPAGEVAIAAPQDDVEIASLTPGKGRGTARGSVHAAFRRGLFAAAYGPDYYRGYVDAHGLIGVDLQLRATPEPLDPVARPTRRSGVPAAVLWSASGLAVTAGVLSTVAAVRAKRDFDQTDIQRTAWDAAERFETHRRRAVIFYAVGAAAGVAGALVFPWRRAPIAVGVDASGAPFAVLRTQW